MSYLKRFLLLGSVSVALLAGLLGTFHSQVSSTAFASGCHTVATGSTGSPNYQPTWHDNCTVSETENSTSNFVSAIQVIINESGARDSHGNRCNAGTVDGKFGTNTFNAVVCFQWASGFPPNEQDGIVGPQTWDALALVLVVWGTNGGWINESANLGASVDFRMWDASPWKWYVYTGSKWCQMNTSSPC